MTCNFCFFPPISHHKLCGYSNRHGSRRHRFSCGGFACEEIFFWCAPKADSNGSVTKMAVFSAIRCVKERQAGGTGYLIENGQCIAISFTDTKPQKTICRQSQCCSSMKWRGSDGAEGFSSLQNKTNEDVEHIKVTSYIANGSRQHTSTIQDLSTSMTFPRATAPSPNQNGPLL